MSELGLEALVVAGGASACEPNFVIAECFRIEAYIRRAAETGVLEVYQNEKLVYQATDLVTGTTPWGQWYVGNLANALMPPDSTAYEDDVMIRATWQ